MFDNILTGVLTFSLLAGGTVAIGAEMVRGVPAAAVTARAADKTEVTLQGVVVTGHRRAPAGVTVASL